jgi:hypothetical protein
MEAEVSEADVKAGDMLLLCTDGLSNVVADEDITRALIQASSAQSAADKLVQMAVKSGGRDNITAVVARLQAGTRTLRMQVADLVRPASSAAETASGTNAASNGIAHAYAAPRRSVFWPLVSAALLLALLAVVTWGDLTVRTLARDGYTFQATPPYAVPPVHPAPPLPPDLAHVAYDTPKPFYLNPVRGDFLSVNPADGVVTVATLTGTVAALDPSDGKLRYKYTLPFVKPLPPAPAIPSGVAVPVGFAGSVGIAGSVGFGGVTLHTATDPQGNLYVSNAVTKTVTKYRPNGVPLGLVAHSTLKNPQAVGASADGTVYLIDSGHLLVLHAYPSATPLPSIPVVVPPAPAALPATHPAVPVPLSSRRSGYRHYGYRR